MVPKTKIRSVISFILAFLTQEPMLANRFSNCKNGHEFLLCSLFSPKIPHICFFGGWGVVSDNTEISSGRVTNTGALSVKKYTQKTNTFKKGECIFTSTHHSFFKKNT